MMRLFLTAAAISLTCAGQASADFIVNGNFDTGSLTPWTQTGGVVISSGNPHSSPDDALFNVSSLAKLSQTITGISGAGTFVLDFWFLYSNHNDQSLEEIFDGTTYNVFPIGSTTGTGSYKHFSLTVTGTHASPVLTFQTVDPSNFMRLDDVTLNASSTPEPSTIVLMGMGSIGAIFGFARRRRQRLSA